MDATTTSRAHEDHYRDIANELRLIVLKMKQAEAAEELRLLAIRYEGFAEHAATSIVTRK
jgi:hypothetical protein